jgi:hypothetical protein
MKSIRCHFGVPVHRSAGSVSSQSLKKSWNLDWRLRPLRSVCAPGAGSGAGQPTCRSDRGHGRPLGETPGEQGRGTDQSGRSGMSRGRPSCPEGV